MCRIKYGLRKPTKHKKLLVRVLFPGRRLPSPAPRPCLKATGSPGKNCYHGGPSLRPCRGSKEHIEFFFRILFHRIGHKRPWRRTRGSLGTTPGAKPWSRPGLARATRPEIVDIKPWVFHCENENCSIFRSRDINLETLLAFRPPLLLLLLLRDGDLLYITST